MGTDINIAAAPGMPPVTTTSSGVTSGVTSGTGTEGIVQTPEAAAAQQGVQDAAGNVAAAEGNVTNTIAPSLEAKAAALDAKGNLLADDSERQRLLNERMPAIKEAEKQMREAQDRYANHQFYDYFSSRSTGDKILSKLAIALNAGVNAYLGIPGNELADALQHEADRDFEKQKIALHSKEQLMQWKKEGYKDLYDKLQTELAALDVKHAHAVEAIGAKAEAMALRAGIPAEVAKQNVVVAKAQESAAQKKLEAAQRYEKHASSKQDFSKQSNSSVSTVENKGGSSGGVEADKAATHYELMKENGSWIASQMPKLSADDVKAINRAIDSNAFRESHPTVAGVLNAAGIDPEKGISPLAKEYVDRIARASAALGRMDSGAAIGTTENMRFVDSFRPRVTDSSGEASKRASNIMKDIEIRGKHLARGTNPAAAAAGGGSVNDLVKIKSGKYAGKMARKMPDGSYELAE